MKITLTFLDGETATDDRPNATGVIIHGNGRRAITLIHATHPRYRVKGYTLSPHPNDPNNRHPVGYNPDRFIDGYFDHRHQNAMWVDPHANQPDDMRRDPAEWKTLDDLVAILKPLLKR